MAMISWVPFQLSGRYAEHNKWENLNGPGDSRVTGRQIIQDEGLVNAWTDKVVLITGVSAGMGFETYRAIASTGATVYGIVDVRNFEQALEALGSVENINARTHLLPMDKMDLWSVRACAEHLRKESSKLNIMINNATVMNTTELLTKDGFELEIQTNHLSNFLLFYLLKDLLLASSEPQFHSRVVNVTSSAHGYNPVRVDNLNMNMDGEYNGWRAYGYIATANVWMANQIERLYGAHGLHGYNVHPGSFHSPNSQDYKEEMGAELKGEKMQKYLSSLEQVCATTVYGAVSKELEGKRGLYLQGASVSEFPCPPDGDDLEYGWRSWVFTESSELSLWEINKTMVGYYLA